jgi:energy-converting hydrogenase Eha subunit A
MSHRLLRYLIAIVAGNAIYFAAARHLPAIAQHHLYRLDWGVAIDFAICVICYGMIRLIR